VKVLNWEKDKEKPLKIAYEAVVEAVAWIFKNHNKEQLATKVEFEGNIKNPNIDIWYLIGQVLKNAFIQALYPSLENSVNINSVDGGKAKDSPLQKEISNSGGIIKNKTEPKKTKKQLRQEKRAKKKAEKEKKKAEKEKQKKEDNK